jgi:hypothetical protein
MRIGKLTKAILAVVAIAAMVMGCTRTQEAFEPEYIGGYPTEETAERMFEEYDYQAATQFYVWATRRWVVTNAQSIRLTSVFSHNTWS